MWGVGGEKEREMKGGERGIKKQEGSLKQIFFSVIIIILFQKPHKKPSPYFSTTPQKEKRPFFRQLILNQFKYYCSGSKKLNQFKCYCTGPKILNQFK